MKAKWTSSLVNLYSFGSVIKMAASAAIIYDINEILLVSAKAVSKFG